MCGAHATVRGLLGELVTRPALADRDLVVDMEAGLEHLSRGTGRHVSSFLAVLEPYYRSMETVRRISDLAAELGVSDVQVVVNKVRTSEDRAAIATFCETHRLKVVAEIPFDPLLADAERSGRPPIDASPLSPAVSAIDRLAERLAGSAV
jgi:CO dehydrogenase maturation factor